MTIRERPILFSGEMVRRLLDGTKTQTRRICKVQPQVTSSNDASWRDGESDLWRNARQYARDCCPHGAVGDHLWVRETWSPMPGYRPIPYPEKYDNKPAWYRADNDRPMWAGTKWSPSIFMPRRCSRLTLEITDVRVQRLQEISEEDAQAEGTDGVTGCKCGRRGEKIAWCGTCKGMCFWSLWDRINKPEFWFEQNPWVFAISFRRTTP